MCCSCDVRFRVKFVAAEGMTTVAAGQLLYWLAQCHQHEPLWTTSDQSPESNSAGSTKGRLQDRLIDLASPKETLVVAMLLERMDRKDVATCCMLCKTIASQPYTRTMHHLVAERVEEKSKPVRYRLVQSPVELLTRQRPVVNHFHTHKLSSDRHSRPHPLTLRGLDGFQMLAAAAAGCAHDVLRNADDSKLKTDIWHLRFAFCVGAALFGDKDLFQLMMDAFPQLVRVLSNCSY